MTPGADPHIPIVYGQGYTKACKLCGRRIWMVPQAPPAKGWLAVDLEHDEGRGNVAIDAFGRAYVLGHPEAHQEELFVVHQATCPVYLERRAEQRQTRLDIDG